MSQVRACQTVRRDAKGWKIVTLAEVKPPFLGPGDMARGCLEHLKAPGLLGCATQPVPGRHRFKATQGPLGLARDR